MEIEHLFDTILVSYEVKSEKPQREIFEECKHRLNITSNNIVHVGNSLEYDVLAACSLGWMAVHYNPSGSTPDTIVREAGDEEGIYICSQKDKSWLEIKCLSDVAKMVA